MDLSGISTKDGVKDLSSLGLTMCTKCLIRFNCNVEIEVSRAFSNKHHTVMIYAKQLVMDTTPEKMTTVACMIKEQALDKGSLYKVNRDKIYQLLECDSDGAIDPKNYKT